MIFVFLTFYISMILPPYDSCKSFLLPIKDMINFAEAVNIKEQNHQKSIWMRMTREKVLQINHPDAHKNRRKFYHYILSDLLNTIMYENKFQNSPLFTSCLPMYICMCVVLLMYKLFLNVKYYTDTHDEGRKTCWENLYIHSVGLLRFEYKIAYLMLHYKNDFRAKRF